MGGVAGATPRTPPTFQGQLAAGRAYIKGGRGTSGGGKTVTCVQVTEVSSDTVTAGLGDLREPDESPLN